MDILSFFYLNPQCPLSNKICSINDPDLELDIVGIIFSQNSIFPFKMGISCSKVTYWYLLVTLYCYDQIGVYIVLFFVFIIVNWNIFDRLSYLQQFWPLFPSFFYGGNMKNVINFLPYDAKLDLGQKNEKIFKKIYI